jgi:predicted transglutaminase-like cysteine proteinase
VGSKSGKNGQKISQQGGIFIKIKSYLERNRVGELMVMKGLISPENLKEALRLQKSHGKPLGEILVEFNFISSRQLQKTLFRQRFLKLAAGILLCTASLSAFSSKRAMAQSIPDVPAKIAISVSAHFSAVAPNHALFGSEEKENRNLKPFTKWTEMFDKFNKQIKSESGQREIENWQAQLRQFKDLPLQSMAQKVNDFVNEARYITDQNNYGMSDYWATPIEFLQRGGDCEDFAITKYTALRMLGVPEERLRIAIVHDNIKNIPHAILVVYTDNGAYILDNQEKRMHNSANFNRYRPIFSINQQAWWMHTTPQTTVLASAR